MTNTMMVSNVDSFTAYKACRTNDVSGQAGGPGAELVRTSLKEIRLGALSLMGIPRLFLEYHKENTTSL